MPDSTRATQPVTRHDMDTDRPSRAAASGSAAPRPLKPTSPRMEYWRVARVADYLDVSRKRVYQLVAEGRIDAIRIGPRQMRIERRSLEAYVRHLHAEQQTEDSA